VRPITVSDGSWRAATAALVAGSLRTIQGDYVQAFGVAGATGLIAAVLALTIGRRTQRTAAELVSPA